MIHTGKFVIVNNTLFPFFWKRVFPVFPRKEKNMVFGTNFKTRLCMSMIHGCGKDSTTAIFVRH